MKLKQTLEFRWFLVMMGVATAGGLWSPEAKANVYATNLKLNDGTTNITTAAGQSVKLSYILNEPASLGVEIDISTGGSVVRRLTVEAGNPGTDRGLNSVFWDGLDNSSNNVASGTYQVSVTPSSSGYTNWTQITSEDDPGAYVWAGRGIAVDRNAASPYYGRVFVSNADTGLSPGTTPGDVIGILKLNADVTFAADGASSGGQDGHQWSGQDVSPWKARVSDDDFVYVDDLGLNGEVFRWDPLLSSNSLTSVLRSDNIPAGAKLSGPAILGTGTNTQIWMADTNGANGILKWKLVAGGVCGSNDLGTTIVGVGTAPTNGLSVSPYAVAVDKSSNLYTCQFTTAANDPISRVFRFLAYDPATNSGLPELTADWAVGGGDDTYAGASGLAVDPTGTYLAVAFQGLEIGGVFQGGNAKVLYTTNGALVANLDLGVAITVDANHQDTACDWDAVGNVCYVDYWYGKWRAFSPPGTNHSTTVALNTIEVTGGSTGGPPPTITSISVTGVNVTIDFTGTTSDTISSFAVVGAPVVTGPFSKIANANIAQLSPGVFRATFASTGSMAYYKIQRVGGGTTPSGQAPLITNLTVTNKVATVTFNGATTDSASQFSLLSAGVASGPYSATGAPVTTVSPGVFRASVNATNPLQFYRIQR